MSSVYIISASQTGTKPAQPSVVLKLSSDQPAKKIYRTIKEQLPKARIGVFSACTPVENSRKEQAAKYSCLVDNAIDFIHAVRACEAKTHYTRIAL